MSDVCGQVADRPEQEDLPGVGCLADGDAEALDLQCFRCGVCCSMYHVRIGRAEACRLAAHMGLELYDWVGRYCEPRWPDPRTYLIRHENGACVFLQRQEDARFALCNVYSVRPESCRDWAAGAYKPACAEGLRSCWGVTVDEDGRFVGEPEAIERVRGLTRQIIV